MDYKHAPSELFDIIDSDAERILRKIDLSEILGKTVLVTGASGLIGVYFLACLKRFASCNPDQFTVIASMFSAPDRQLSAFLDYSGACVLSGDLADPEVCKGLQAADYIIHAAGYAQPGRFMKNPLKTLQLNTVASFSLLEKLKPYGKALFVSTSEVYSGLRKMPYKESDIGTTNTTHPRACYIEAKRCGEAIFNAYREKGVNAKSVRLSLAYGPGTKCGDLRVVNSFIQKALAGRITLMDQGDASRTYCYVSDAVEMMWNILLKGKEPIYNVGGVSKVTIGGLARKIGAYLNVPVVFPADAKCIAGAPDDVSLDLTRVNAEFGAKEFVSFDWGLERTIEWQKLLYRSR